MSRSYQLLRRAAKYIRCYALATISATIFCVLQGLTEILCNREVVNKGKGVAAGCITLGRVLRPVACYLPGVHFQDLHPTAIRLLPPQVCTYGFRCKVQTIRKGTIRAAPALRCDPASTGSARRPSSTRRPAAPEGREEWSG